MTGKKTKPGDIILEKTGGGSGKSSGTRTHFLTIWEMPETWDGSAKYYNYTGSASLYKWGRPHQGYILNPQDLSEELIYAFTHGLHNIEYEYHYPELENGIKFESSYQSALKMLYQSDWEKQNYAKHSVETTSRLVRLSEKWSDLDDIKADLEEIKDCPHLPMSVVYKVLEVADTPLAPVFNGESGIAAYSDALSFHCLIQHLDQEKPV